MAAAYKLTYFNFRGLAETSRFLLKYGGIEFDDERFEREQWPQIKPSMPFGQVPLLTANGKQYNQSVSMARFLAKQVKLNGKDDFEDLEIDSIVDTVSDLRIKFVQYLFEQDETVKEGRKESLISETIPYYMERLDKIAKENNGHLACKRLTWADMYFVALLDTLNYIIGMDIIAKYPSIETVKKNVHSLPAIKQWIETRPKTDL